MNSQRQNTLLYLRLVFALLVFAISLGLVIRGATNSAIDRGSKAETAQEAEKSLDINRYPKEPLELIDLKLGQNSLKNKIRLKFKVPDSQDGFDNVKFNEKPNWFKKVKVRLRNISGRPIYGIGASLYFKPEGVRMFFSIPLRSKHRDLKLQSLQPNEDVELELNEELSSRMIQQMQDYGIDPNETQISLSVDSAKFSDNFGWYRGTLTKRDPYSPNKVDPVDKPIPSPEPFEASRLFQPAGFKLNSASLGPNLPPDLTICQQGHGGWLATQCQNDVSPNCYGRWTEMGNNVPGRNSVFPIQTFCSVEPAEGFCETATTNYLMAFDPDCPAPGATPPPLSCLPDGYVYFPGGIPCCSGPAFEGICGATPTPTPMTCVPNGQYNFGVIPCCSGYVNPDGYCAPNPSPSPPCLPNGSLCFLPSACCSGNCTDFACASPTPTPTPTPEECYYWDWWVCMQDHAVWLGYPDCYCLYTPIVIDISGNGFALSDAAAGVLFDLNVDGIKERIAWTRPNSDDAWLALDVNGNGNIDDRRELFGNSSQFENGFLALAKYDKPEVGGNADGVINKHDAIFPNLRLWQDINHDGISQSGELHPLKALGLKVLDLDYKVSRRTDQYGNRFRYRAKVKDTHDAQLGRWAWDVFLVVAR